MKAKNKFYAYFLLNRQSGICDNWAECEKKVKGVAGARFRGFKTAKEAEDWLSSGARYESKVHGPWPGRRAGKSPKRKVNLVPGIYFDAGTGRGMGVEISVTDEAGNNLLHKVMPKSKINEFGKHHLGKDFTNNYGELMACQYALRLALKKNIKNIFGDSKLVIEYWSKGYIKRKELPVATVKLTDKVVKLRKRFELLGGKMTHISGDNHPADLGFH